MSYLLIANIVYYYKNTEYEAYLKNTEYEAYLKNTEYEAYLKNTEYESSFMQLLQVMKSILECLILVSQILFWNAVCKLCLQIKKKYEISTMIMINHCYTGVKYKDFRRNTKSKVSPDMNKKSLLNNIKCWLRFDKNPFPGTGKKLGTV
jgi:hypothetical protein